MTEQEEPNRANVHPTQRVLELNVRNPVREPHQLIAECHCEELVAKVHASVCTCRQRVCKEGVKQHCNVGGY